MARHAVTSICSIGGRLEDEAAIPWPRHVNVGKCDCRGGDPAVAAREAHAGPQRGDGGSGCCVATSGCVQRLAGQFEPIPISIQGCQLDPVCIAQVEFRPQPGDMGVERACLHVGRFAPQAFEQILAGKG